jgi:hypothetical protein
LQGLHAVFGNCRSGARPALGARFRASNAVPVVTPDKADLSRVMDRGAYHRCGAQNGRIMDIPKAVASAGTTFGRKPVRQPGRSGRVSEVLTSLGTEMRRGGAISSENAEAVATGFDRSGPSRTLSRRAWDGTPLPGAWARRMSRQGAARKQGPRSAAPGLLRCSRRRDAGLSQCGNSSAHFSKVAGVCMRS